VEFFSYYTGEFFASPFPFSSLRFPVSPIRPFNIFTMGYQPAANSFFLFPLPFYPYAGMKEKISFPHDTNAYSTGL